MNPSSRRWTGPIGVALLFTGWAAAFIYRSSFVAIDGRRYFCLFDDAMISMRYAFNLAHGDGLVWNAGERIEGITNLLMTLFMAPLTRLLDKSHAVLAVQVSGVLFLLAIAWLTLKIGERLLEGPSRLLISTLFFAGALVYYPLDFWTLMGMETGLLAVLLLGAVWLVLRVDGEARFNPGLALLLGLALLTRPDASVPVAVILLYRFVGLRRERGWLRVAIAEAAVVGAFALGVAGFRYFYYGTIAPNTYTLKVTGMDVGIRIRNGFTFLKPFAISIWPALVVALPALFTAHRRQAALLVTLFVASLGSQIWVGGDAWPYWRMLAPYVPLLLVLATLTLTRAVERLTPLQVKGGSHPLAHFLRATATVGAWSLLVLHANRDFRPEQFFQEPAYFVTSNFDNVNTALVLCQITTPGATVGVFWAGAIPYYSERRAIDFLGKNDRHIANLSPRRRGRFAAIPGHNKYDLSYSIGVLQPTYVQSHSWGRHTVRGYVRSNYETFQVRGLTLWLKRESPHVNWKLVHQRKRLLKQLRQAGTEAS